MILRFSIVLLFISLLSLSAPADYDGGMWGAWLSNAYDARNTALANANVALADDAWATRANPAGLGQLLEGEARFTYAQPFADIDDIYVGSVGIARPILTGSFTPGTFAFNLSYLYAGGIPEADYGGTTGRLFSNNEMEILLGWGKGFGENLETGKPNDFFVGTNLKIYSQKVDDYRGKGFGMDVGVLSQQIEMLNWGVSIRNLVPAGYRVNALGDLAPTTLAGGFVFKPIPELAFTTEGSADTDMDYDAATGLEVCPIALVALRGGYRLSNESPSFGAGLRLNNVGLDYAGVLHPELGLGNRVTLGLWF